MNRLGNESSLYLRQHADNPVNWQPWDEQALGDARKQDRPILLSIGYSACHWCHVMAHESFEHEATAELMNRHFVNIKVDREERPDLDRIYQIAHQLLTGRGGGWPLTLFLDPVEHIPFFAGTYFPLERRYGMPAFREVLEALGPWFVEHRNEVGEQNDKLSAALQSIQNPAAGNSGQVSPESASEILQLAAGQIQNRHDRVNGGYGGAPKFPQAPLLEAIANLGDLEAGDSLHEGLRQTLEKMALSGLRDHLDGGFFRYCVDANWTIPHFEKMLYDNAMLLPLYAEGARRWDNPLMKTSAEGIAQWLETTMRHDSGAYSASIDADADGQEGGFHVWSREEVESVLGGIDPGPKAESGPGRLADIFVQAHGLDQPPNFENQSWHLIRRIGSAALAEKFNETQQAIEESLADATVALREKRSGRVHPTLDDKQLASWNALLALGFIRAGRALEREDWLDRAEQIFRFIERELWTGDNLLAVYNAGEARFEAYLDDYAWLLNALMASLQARWSRTNLDFAIQLADALLLRFEDAGNGGFHFSDSAVEVPITRSMIFQDDATPSGNAIAIGALNRLARLLGEPRYSEAADRCLARSMTALKESPMAHASLLTALQDSVQPAPHIVISGSNPKQRSALKHWVEGRYQVDCYMFGPEEDSLPGILREYRSESPVTAWLCRGMQCLSPVESREELKRQLETS
jgi:uncharacterized protein YyaL (SSP411 family)